LLGQWQGTRAGDDTSSNAGRLQAVLRRGGGVGTLAALLLPLGVEAQGAGDLDTRFSGEGTVTTARLKTVPAGANTERRRR
jgi:hypothetical protein